MLRWILITLLATQAATCGQKGPLTLPEARLAVTGAGQSLRAP
jgi:predicted small lipoprotein YifL